MKRLLTIFLALFGVALLVSCHHSDPIIEEEEPTADHTLLIYMAADNNGMAKFCDGNINACIQGLREAKQPLNLIIFKDTGAKPVLFQLKRNAKNKQKVDTLYIKKYTEYVNTSDPAFLAEVVNATFEACPARIKGFEYWSHGGSWVPDGWSPSKAQAARPAQRASQYIGVDNYRYMQLWEFREALEKCPHLDYILFDACNMATAEVAYELRQHCDYIFASAQEIMGDGFPYATMVASLSDAYKSGVEPTLRTCVDLMQQRYPSNGSLSLIKSAEMDPLAQAYAQLLLEHPGQLEILSQNAYSIQSGWQHYGGGDPTRSIYYYYDLAEVAEYLEGDVSAQLKSAVPYSYCAPSYYSMYDGCNHALTHFTGLAVSVPEFFGLCRGNSYLREGYHQTQWGQLMGY